MKALTKLLKLKVTADKSSKAVIQELKNQRILDKFRNLIVAEESKTYYE